MKVLVCGGRDYGVGGPLPAGISRADAAVHWRRIEAERFLLTETLDVLHRDHGIDLLIHGDQRGADRLAAEWAAAKGVEVLPFPANWTAAGRSGGPIRNARMLAEGRPDLVVAFPGGSGTADMVAKAKRAGVTVMDVRREWE